MDWEPLTAPLSPRTDRQRPTTSRAEHELAATAAADRWKASAEVFTAATRHSSRFSVGQRRHFMHTATRPEAVQITFKRFVPGS